MPTYTVCVLAADAGSIRVVHVNADCWIWAYRMACASLNTEGGACEENEDLASASFLRRMLRDWPPLHVSEGTFKLPEGLSGSQLEAEIALLS